MPRKNVDVSTVMFRQRLGLEESDDAIWLVSFMHHGLVSVESARRGLFVQHLTPHASCRCADLKHTIENACPPPWEWKKTLDARAASFLERNLHRSWMTVARGIDPFDYCS